MKRIEIYQTPKVINLKFKLAADEKPNKVEIDTLQLKNLGNIRVPVYHAGMFSSSFNLDIPNADTLKKVLSGGLIFDRFLEIFEDIVSCMDSAERLDLRLSGLLLDLEGIFVLRSSGSIQMIYIPCVTKEPMPNIFHFLVSIIDAVIITDESGGKLKKLRESILSQNEISFTRIKQSIEKLRGKKVIEHSNVLPDVSEFSENKTLLLDQEIKDTDSTLLMFGKRDISAYFDSENPERSFKVSKDSFMIGRSVRADHCISDNEAISNIHAEIIHEDNQYYIQDQYSSNGTMINGEKIQPGERTPLSENDKVQFADEEFVFHIR